MNVLIKTNCQAKMASKDHRHKSEEKTIQLLERILHLRVEGHCKATTFTLKTSLFVTDHEPAFAYIISFTSLRKIIRLLDAVQCRNFMCNSETSHKVIKKVW